jgi:hypothetical protein
MILDPFKAHNACTHIEWFTRLDVNFPYGIAELNPAEATEL